MFVLPTLVDHQMCVDHLHAQPRNVCLLIDVYSNPMRFGCVQGSLAVVLCRINVAATPHVLVKRCHAPCGRGLQRASLGCGDMFDDELPAADAVGEAIVPSPGLYVSSCASCFWMLGLCCTCYAVFNARVCTSVHE